MGTRFVATHECDADEAFKQLYVNSKKEDMVIIKSPVGLPGRAVRNSFIDQVKMGEKKPFKCPFHCIKTCKGQESPYCIAIALANARRGKFKHGFAFAGKNAYRINEIISVKELMESLKAEFLLAAALEEGYRKNRLAFAQKGGRWLLEDQPDSRKRSQQRCGDNQW